MSPRAPSLCVLLLAACAPAAPPEPAAGCNPLVGDDCLTPFPSSFWEQPADGTATGVQVHLPEDLLPANGDGVRFSSARLNREDGFSPATFFTVYFANGVDPASLPAWDDQATTVTAASPVQVLEVSTGERVPLLVELDANALPGDRQALLIRPVRRLRPATRYAVALVGLRDRQGRPLIPAPFQALRDRTALSRALVPLASRAEELFTALAQAGVPRQTLTLAWDVVTASEAATTGHLTRMVPEARALADQMALGYTIDSVTDSPDDPHLLRRITGTFRVPSYLTADAPGATLNLGPDGEPLLRGIGDAGFVVHIPQCAKTAQAPLPVMVFGHGLFGAAESELAGEYQKQLGDRLCMVQIGTDWIGLSKSDVPVLANKVVGDLNQLILVTDRLQQAHVNAQLLPRRFAATLKNDPALALGGNPVTDGQELYYLGVSGGGVQGSTFMALSTEIERGILHAAGGEWSLMMQRSDGFSALKVVFDSVYPDLLDQQILVSLTQSEWDKTDPISFASHLLADPLPGVKPKRILLQEGIGDAAVPNVASRVLARTLGLPGLDLEQPVYGVEPGAAPLDSAYTQWDVHPTPLPPVGNQVARSNAAHEAVRRLDLVQQQMQRFFRPDGRVEKVCPGTICSF